MFIINTATTVSENCTYIQNPNFPAGDTSATGYSYTINKCSSAVCFLRLDFETFTITGPANTLDDGICVSDTFSVTVNAAAKLLSTVMTLSTKMPVLAFASQIS